MSRSHFIDGEWVDGSGEDRVDNAARSSRSALHDWSSRTTEDRARFLVAFAEQLKKHRDSLSLTISRETGKPVWESLGEVDSMIGKIGLSVEAQAKRRQEVTSESAGVVSATRYKPHGVVAVLGPFNFPGHLPNGHIVPALLAGNTVVFKPSELTPTTADETIKLWSAAGIPPGVINLVHGARETGAALISHQGIDGVFFTGSFTTGRAISRALADQPGKITALEMGGNNPLIVHGVADLTAAAYWTTQSAFISAGQRCSCARRLILVDGDESRRFVECLARMIGKIRVGSFDENPEPFMGPVISTTSAQNLLKAQSELVARSGRLLVEMKTIRDALLSPGLIDVTDVADRSDDELFGPILQVIRVRDFDAAIIEANNTRFGLAAGLFCDDRLLFERLSREIRAGVVNWNRPTTGASSALPFGGVGCSGNHRPSAYFAADYCSYPVAMIETDKLTLPAKLAPGITI